MFVIAHRHEGMNGDAKKRILARRAQLVAAALAAAACEPKPEPCLSVVQVPPPADAGEPVSADDSGPPPAPCLSPVALPPPDASSQADAGQPDAGPPPLPCLSPMPPKPRVCLTK
jgi:hypothetical protein